MELQSLIVNHVKELRIRSGLRQSDLAQRVGVTRQTILAIEKGRLNPSILVCLRIAAALDAPVDAIFALSPGSTQGALGVERIADRTAKQN